MDRTDAAWVKKFIGLLELSNLKQGAFLSTINLLLQTQVKFFETKDMADLAPISLRKVAKQLKFAPSTVSRVMSNKSIMLPWDREVLVSYLMPGQRRVVLSIVDKVLAALRKQPTDAELARIIEKDYAIKVSRRTITACRHALLSEHQKKKAA